MLAKETNTSTNRRVERSSISWGIKSGTFGAP